MTLSPSTSRQYATRASWAASTWTDVVWLGPAVCPSHQPTMDLRTSTSEQSSTSSASASSSLTLTTTCSSTSRNTNTSSQVRTNRHTRHLISVHFWSPSQSRGSRVRTPQPWGEWPMRFSQIHASAWIVINWELYKVIFRSHIKLGWVSGDGQYMQSVNVLGRVVVNCRDHGEDSAWEAGEPRMSWSVSTSGQGRSTRRTTNWPVRLPLSLSISISLCRLHCAPCMGATTAENGRGPDHTRSKCQFGLIVFPFSHPFFSIFYCCIPIAVPPTFFRHRFPSS